ncbi:MAG TPA: amidohydrolase family protein [Pseudomonadales bacterium]
MSEQAQVYARVRVWDGVAQTYLDGVDAVRVERGAITALGDVKEISAGALVRDMGGVALVPGLIDAHVHMVLDPDVRDPLAQARGAETQRDALARRANAMVRAGITSARDLGGGEWLELELRDRIARGEVMGPRLLCAGQPVTSPGGHCHFWGGEAAGVVEAATVIARQDEHGVDLIKVMATGGSLTKGSTPRMAQFDGDTLAAIVADARQRGYPVAAHCHGTEGIRFAVHAGVNTIEHCSWVGEGGWATDYDAALAETMAARRVWVSPTVNLGWKRHVGSGTEHEGRLLRNYAAMRAAGVPLAASTDAGIPNVRHEDLAKALPVFAYFTQFSNVEALKSATSSCARAIGIGHRTGRLAKGFAADLLFVDGDPLADLTCLTTPVAVVARGVAIDLN